MDLRWVALRVEQMAASTALPMVGSTVSLKVEQMDVWRASNTAAGMGLNEVGVTAAITVVLMVALKVSKKVGQLDALKVSKMVAAMVEQMAVLMVG